MNQCALLHQALFLTLLLRRLNPGSAGSLATRDTTARPCAAARRRLSILCLGARGMVSGSCFFVANSVCYSDRALLHAFGRQVVCSYTRAVQSRVLIRAESMHALVCPCGSDLLLPLSRRHGPCPQVPCTLPYSVSALQSPIACKSVD